VRAVLGQLGLSVGFAAAVGGVAWWLLAARGGQRAKANARLATRMMFTGALVACAALVWALVTHDFSVRYVAENGGRAVPLYYTVISLWAALEGSILLWLAVLTGLALRCMRTVHPRAVGLQPWAMATLCGVAVFFFALALFGANPFELVSPVPADGPGPNPLLQDHPLMGAHPPLLYLGYVGMAVPFAYAVAALVTGSTGRAWVLVTRRWTLFAWTCLTAGIILGGWWSYEVLGWGGYWAWDPVENASIVPWFTATALLHSVMVQERRATLRVWNLALAVATFVLVLVGTFLTRSGVIASVHSFTQSAVGPMLLGFIAVVLLGAGGLFVWRADRLGPDEGLDGVLSREAVFLANNVILVGLAFTVLIGTVFPLLLEAVNGQRVSVGAPYFNRMAVPLALVLVVLMGVGPLVPWNLADPRALGRRLVGPAGVGLAVVAALGLGGLRGLAALAVFGLAAFVLATIIVQFAEGIYAARASTGAAWPRAALVAVGRRRRLYGGLIVHAGVVLAAVAIAASHAYAYEGQRELRVGESFTVGPYRAELVGVEQRSSPRKNSLVARVALSRGEASYGVHEPSLSFYPSTTDAIGTPSVQTRLGEDVYVTLPAIDAQRGVATVRVTVNPLVVWLWVAGFVMVAGALLAGWPSPRAPWRARRRPVRRSEVAPAAEAVRQ